MQGSCTWRWGWLARAIMLMRGRPYLYYKIFPFSNSLSRTSSISLSVLTWNEDIFHPNFPTWHFRQEWTVQHVTCGDMFNCHSLPKFCQVLSSALPFWWKIILHCWRWDCSRCHETTIRYFLFSVFSLES